MENISTLKELLATPKDIAITAHRNPDGDAIGSALAMYHFLKKLHHNPFIIFPSEYPEVFSWMEDSEHILIYDVDQEKSLQKFQQAQMVFCLDFNALDRIDKLGEALNDMRIPVVMIDHHIDPEPFADYVLSDNTASSTAELVYDFIYLLGKESTLDTTIGDCIYTGIVTDTGSFKFSTSPKLFQIVAKLLELGVDDYTLQDRIYNCLPEKQLRILGHCLANRMEILAEYKTGIITLTKRDYERFSIQRGDTEGVVNYILKLKNINIAAFITEQPTIVKLSLRSKGDFSVQEIAAKHFKGGGHKNAAGGSSYQSLRGTVNRFKELLPEYVVKS